ncbi:MAG: tRNA (adenosine(37)-N6)-dimethylallyltransferase MiaA [Bacteroidaceae bacterium]|nr:tRNA (adenosine(37)-N6)-dimethylallyltransferase MiaA [Bacteroidaceae bacterium]
MRTLVVLLGPTAVGKTELSLSLAEMLGCPIINCDSRQLFSDLKIGTAAPTAAQQQRVQHFFVSTLGLDEYYSAAQYEADVLHLTQELFPTHDTLLLSGGSMMYIDAVCKGIDDIPTISDEVRTLVKKQLEENGLAELVETLHKLDPEYYTIVDKQNTRRVVHALEVCYMSGRTYTSFRTQSQKPRPFRIIKIGLNRPREELFQRINERVEQMMHDGLLDEVRRFSVYRHCNALNTVGYKELLHVLDGEWELPMAVERIKKNTRVYAKKQLTWFRRDESITWFHPDDVETIKQFINTKLHETNLAEN